MSRSTGGTAAARCQSENSPGFFLRMVVVKGLRQGICYPRGGTSSPARPRGHVTGSDRRRRIVLQPCVAGSLDRRAGIHDIEVHALAWHSHTRSSTVKHPNPTVPDRGALAHFHPLLRSWFELAVGTPTDIQEQAWAHIARGHHVLCIAPTGCGKTLAAFYHAINRLVTGEWPCGATQVLYVSPLKALNNDIRRNLLAPLEALRRHFAQHGEQAFPDITVLTRSGDTESAERRRMLRSPPEILITTPESLNILVNSQSGRRALTDVKAVILDEIHAVAGNKRGTHLITAVDRLVRLSGEFQRIGLSATVRPPEKVSELIGGYRLEPGPEPVYLQRRVFVCSSKTAKRYQVRITSPSDDADDLSKEGRWQWLVTHCLERIRRNTSTLIFTNNRAQSEKLARFINEEAGERLVYTHHGSLSKELRRLVEQKMKAGELKAIVATSSLELGIDIGALDEVLLVGAPFSLASSIQRIGRAGHSVNQVSRGELLPLFEGDIIRCCVVAKAVNDQTIESVEIPRSPLDMCAQAILGMTLCESWDRDELYRVLRTSYPFHELSRAQYDQVVDMLCGRYADSRIRELKPRLSYDGVDNVLTAGPGVRMLLNMSGGTIPDRGYYTLRHETTKQKIGELDEEFVWERRVGDSFSLGTQNWTIREITSQYVDVQPLPRSAAMPPFWRIDRFGHDFVFGEQTGRFLEKCEELRNDKGLVGYLRDVHCCSEKSAFALIELLDRERRALGCPLPHRHHLVIEHFADKQNSSGLKQVVLHTFWGITVNAPFATALAQAWEGQFGYPLQVYHDDNCIMLNLPHEVSERHIMGMVTPYNLEKLLRGKLESTGVFGAYFRENAARALLLPKKSRKRTPLWLNRLRSKKLMAAVSRYTDFPVLTETWRTCLKDDFDLDALKMLLTEIEEGTIAISEAWTESASPFAANIIWRQTNDLMYADDSQQSAGPTSLSDQAIKDILAVSELRPSFSAALLEEFRAKLQRTLPDYAPQTARDLLDWTKERVLIPADEWRELTEATAAAGGACDDPRKTIAAKLKTVTPPGSALESVAAVDTLKRLSTLFGEKGPKPEAAQEIVAEWLRYYGPIAEERLLRVWGFAAESWAAIKNLLVEQGLIVEDRFIEGSEDVQICDAQNFEKLLRLNARKQRTDEKALGREYLQLFLARHQGLLTPGNSIEDLQKSLDKLWGFPAPATLWETTLLPSRLGPYFGNWLDSLMAQHPIVWFGCGRRKMSFCFEGEIDLFNETRAVPAKLRELFPNLDGGFSLEALARHSRGSIDRITETLWQYCWKGHVSNSRLEPLRAAVESGFRLTKAANPDDEHPKHIYNRWLGSRMFNGSWFVLHGEPADDALDKLERDKARV
ncbi:MAG: DEAD/DEAH box helicase, partial [Chitinivibrionales bacterium]|nr:DEAD/DEAH box helicase [Chitinivibrionales bacterium]